MHGNTWCPISGASIKVYCEVSAIFQNATTTHAATAASAPASRRPKGSHMEPAGYHSFAEDHKQLGPWISPLPALLRGRRAGADELGDLRGPGARGVHVAFVLDAAIQGGQVLLQTNHPFALDGGTQQVERLDDAQSV